MSYGTLLSVARRNAGLTLAQVAKAAGTSASYVHDVESGRRLPFDTRRTLAIARLLDVYPHPLLRAALVERGCLEVPAEHTQAVDAAIEALACASEQNRSGPRALDS